VSITVGLRAIAAVPCATVDGKLMIAGVVMMNAMMSVKSRSFLLNFSPSPIVVFDEVV
jgi:phosphatidylserine decarboxylase